MSAVERELRVARGLASCHTDEAAIDEALAEYRDMYEALELVRDLSSTEWKESDGTRKGATDNQGQRLFLISVEIMQAVRAALSKATGAA